MCVGGGGGGIKPCILVINRFLNIYSTIINGNIKDIRYRLNCSLMKDVVPLQMT